MPKLTFHKYQGTGNDFIIVDDREGMWDGFLTRDHVAFLCNRRFGIGADGLMLLKSHSSLDFTMKYFNSDGNESSMCGNGGRCLVEFAWQLGVVGETCRFEAIDGLHLAERKPDQVRLKMSKPTGLVHESDSRDWLDTGSPHLVVWTSGAVEAVNVRQAGAEYRHEARYQPGGTNVNFSHPSGPESLRVRTFERGVEDETLSCGTGVTACAYAWMVRQEMTKGIIEVSTPGGKLSVDVRNRSEADEEVWLCGPATFVFEGSIQLT